MSTRPYEGNLFAYYAPAIDSIAAPTVAEVITAGTDLTPGMVATGLAPNHTENTVSTPMLNGFIRQNIGTEGVTFNMQFVYDPDTEATDEIWDLFDERSKAGFLVLFPDGAGGAGGVPEATDRCEVYPASFGRRKQVQSAQDTDMQFTVMVAVNADYDDDATLTA